MARAKIQRIIQGPHMDNWVVWKYTVTAQDTWSEQLCICNCRQWICIPLWCYMLFSVSALLHHQTVCGEVSAPIQRNVEFPQFHFVWYCLIFWMVKNIQTLCRAGDKHLCNHHHVQQAHHCCSAPAHVPTHINNQIITVLMQLSSLHKQAIFGSGLIVFRWSQWQRRSHSSKEPFPLD